VYAFHSKNVEISNFTENRPVGAELCHADRRAEEMKDGQTWRSEKSHFAISRTSQTKKGI